MEESSYFEPVFPNQDILPDSIQKSFVARVVLTKDMTKDRPEQQQLNFLSKLMRDINDPTSDAWKRINEDLPKWSPWDCDD